MICDYLICHGNNGPEHLVISGLRSAVAMVLDRLRVEGIGAQWLDVSHAYHSPLMHPILDKFDRWGEPRQSGHCVSL